MTSHETNDSKSNPLEITTPLESTGLIHRVVSLSFPVYLPHGPVLLPRIILPSLTVCPVTGLLIPAPQHLICTELVSLLYICSKIRSSISVLTATLQTRLPLLLDKLFTGMSSSHLFPVFYLKFQPPLLQQHKHKPPSKSIPFCDKANLGFLVLFSQRSDSASPFYAAGSKRALQSSPDESESY